LVAFGLIDFRHIKQTLTFNKSESAILLTTFFATLFLELEFAIYMGVLLSLILFLARTSTPNIPVLSIDRDTKDSHRRFIDVEEKPVKECPQFKIIRIDMSIYFGSVNHIQKVIGNIVANEKIVHILIEASGINFIDLAGAEVLVSENKRLLKQKGGLYFVGLKPSVYEFTAKSGFIKHIGNDHFFDSKSRAIGSIYKRLNKETCSGCQVKIFSECK
jgi:SulP family sulfate permease